MAKTPASPKRDWREPASRILWWALVLVFLFILFNDSAVVFSRPHEVFDYLMSLEASPGAVSPGIAAHGWSENFYLFLYLLPEIIATLGFVAVGFLIGLRRTGGWFTWFISLWMIVFGVTAPSTFGLSGFDTELVLLYNLPILFSFVGIIVFLFSFPDGKFIPAWTRYLAIVWGLFILSTLIWEWFAWESALSALAIVPLLIVVLYSFIYRYRRVFTPAQREQTKWLIGAIVANIVLVALSGIFAGLADASTTLPADAVIFVLLDNSAEFLGNLLLVVAVGVSILRYRLWDIDVIVNRALIYGPLSIILTVIFAVSVALMNQATRQLLGAEATATAAAASAVVVALFFQPLRTGIEGWINRKIYADTGNLARELVEITDPRFDLSTTALSKLVAERVTHVLASDAGALYLADGRGFKRAASAAGKLPQTFNLDAKARKDLEAGKVTNDGPGHLLVPLYVPRLRTKEIVGALALGLRKNGRGYSSDDRRSLVELGGQVGTALHASKLRNK